MNLNYNPWKIKFSSSSSSSLSLSLWPLFTRSCTLKVFIATVFAERYKGNQRKREGCISLAFTSGWLIGLTSNVNEKKKTEEGQWTGHSGRFRFLMRPQRHLGRSSSRCPSSRASKLPLDLLHCLASGAVRSCSPPGLSWQQTPAGRSSWWREFVDPVFASRCSGVSKQRGGSE